MESGGREPVCDISDIAAAPFCVRWLEYTRVKFGGSVVPILAVRCTALNLLVPVTLGATGGGCDLSNSCRSSTAVDKQIWPYLRISIPVGGAKTALSSVNRKEG